MTPIGFAAIDRHVERFEHQFRAQVIGHSPTDDAPAVSIEHDREIQEPGPRRDVGDVGNPKLIGPLGANFRSTRSGAGRASPIANRCHRRICAEKPRKYRVLASIVQRAFPRSRCLHREGRRGYAGDRTSTAIVRNDASIRSPISRSFSAMPRWRAFAPRVVAARGDLEHAAQHGDRYMRPDTLS